MSEPLMQLLADLPAADPDAERAERIRKSCRARLAREAARTSGPAITLTPAWPLLVSALGAAYFIGVMIEAVRVYRLL